MSAAECGTPGGYFAHLRAKETACTPCRKAKAAKEKDRRAARRKVRPAPPVKPRRGWTEPLPPLPPASRPRLTTEELDALCGGPPTVTIHCPEPRCPRILGPYYSATSPDARGALATHMHWRHAAVWTAGIGA